MRDVLVTTQDDRYRLENECNPAKSLDRDDILKISTLFCTKSRLHSAAYKSLIPGPPEMRTLGNRLYVQNNLLLEYNLCL